MAERQDQAHAEDVQRALRSIYHHTTRMPRSPRARMRAPLSIYAALNILAQQTDSRAPARLAFAIRELQRHGPRWIRPAPGDPDPAPAFRALLAAAGIPPHARYFATDRLKGPVEPAEVDVSGPDPFVPHTTYDRHTRIATLEATAAGIALPKAQLARVLDPRSWSRCSELFTETYQIRCDPVSRRPIRARGGRYESLPGVPLGTPWEGLLFERFDGSGFAYENVLAVKLTVSGDTLCTDYRLYSCQRLTLGVFGDCGALRANCGEMKAVRGADGKCTVTVTKKLRFKDFTPGDPGEWYDLGDSFGAFAQVLLAAEARGRVLFNLYADVESDPPPAGPDTSGKDTK